MEKNLLITLGDAGTLSGARFVAEFFSHPEDIRLTFFHNAQNSGGIVPMGGDEVVPVTCGLGDDAAMPHDSLEKARKLLCGSWQGKGRMEAKIVFRQYTKIVDVVLEGEKGLFDAVVLGRRALGWLEDAYGGGGASRGVLEQHSGAPLWICRSVAQGRKNVLLAVDGSPSSTAMADHVGFMLECEPGHRVTLITISPEQSGTSAQAMEALEKALASLLMNGVAEDRIDVKLVSADNVGPALLAEAEESAYAVVAMGRTGVGQGRLGDMFMGSAADYLYQHLRGAALWVCR